MSGLKPRKMGKHGANTAQDIHSLNTWQTPGSPALTVCPNWRPNKKTGPDWLPYNKMGRDWLSVSDGGFRLPYDLNHLIQIGDEVLEVVKATLPDLSQVLSEWNLQLLLQTGVLSNQHLHYHAKRLTVLPVHLLYFLGLGSDGLRSALLEVILGLGGLIDGGQALLTVPL